jgi:hypothetical protein
MSHPLSLLSGFLGPNRVFTFLHLVAKSGPLEFTIGYGTAQFDFGIADPDHFPVPMPLPAFYPDLLPDLKWIGFKQGDVISIHDSSSSIGKNDISP